MAARPAAKRCRYSKTQVRHQRKKDINKNRSQKQHTPTAGTPLPCDAVMGARWVRNGRTEDAAAVPLQRSAGLDEAEVQAPGRASRTGLSMHRAQADSRSGRIRSIQVRTARARAGLGSGRFTTSLSRLGPVQARANSGSGRHWLGPAQAWGDSGSGHLVLGPAPARPDQPGPARRGGHAGASGLGGSADRTRRKRRRKRRRKHRRRERMGRRRLRLRGLGLRARGWARHAGGRRARRTREGLGVALREEPGARHPSLPPPAAAAASGGGPGVTGGTPGGWSPFGPAATSTPALFSP